MVAHQDESIEFATRPERSVLVCGGTSGIGRGIALAFADLGCRVTVTGRTQQEVDVFDASSHPISSLALDVTDPVAVEQLVRDWRRLDVLVNAAGTILRGGQEFDPLGFAQVVDVNLNGTMRICSACHDLLAEHQGCILNIASMLSFFGSGYAPAYSASKGGIVQLTKSLAIAWSADGIRVNAIAPGWIDTPLTQPLLADSRRREEIVQRTPLRRWGRPEDVSGAALFLCSPAAAFITGVVLPVDGGYSIT